ncbi:SpoIIE family protein phosphatase/ATP-binding protein [Yinghuangia aomiensis]|uniref:SpoIIE family protein phosphatase/ATP-binding protein n=1 Tax=Yinghuangia aomiensis TaxID=676205 RepID=A0ABP9HUV9_9ACTN
MSDATPTHGRAVPPPGGPSGASPAVVGRLGVRSVAGQVLLLESVIVVLLVVAAVMSLVLQARNDSLRDARNRTAVAARTFADAPGLPGAMESPDAEALVRPRLTAAHADTGVDAIAVLTADGRFYKAGEVGRLPDLTPIVPGVEEFARTGTVRTMSYSAPDGHTVLTAAPVRDAAGRGVGLVAAAVTVANAQDTANRQLPLVLGSGAVALLLAGSGTFWVTRRLARQTRGLEPAEMTRMYEHHDAVLHAVREGVLIVDNNARVVLVNDEARRLLDLPEDADSRTVGELGLDETWTDLLTSPQNATDEVLLSGERLVAVNKRLANPRDGRSATVLTLRDSTELERQAGHAESIRQRLRLLYDAGVHIGTTLDVVRTARELAEVTAPAFADHVTVDLLDKVLDGDEPPAADTRARRVVSYGLHGEAFHPLDKQFVLDPTGPLAQPIVAGRALVLPDPGADEHWLSRDPQAAERAAAEGIHSLIVVPLRARGVFLGVAGFWRGRTPDPFDEDDAAFAEELGARAGVSVDNARRYTREHAMAVALQRSLLPRGLPEQGALDVAYRYLPAESGVGGDWFDVIPLSGARVALVVGDVVGHGLHAAAAMGRLRTAVHNFSALELAPDELLSYLDDLVVRIDQAPNGEEETGPDETGTLTGATCLYAVYDPATGILTAARAGHPGPMLLFPDGRAVLPDIPVAPPLGLCAGLPVDTVDIPLPEDTNLILYTDGLIEDRVHDIDVGLETLRRTVENIGSAAQPEEMCSRTVAALVAQQPRDDIALVVVRTRRLRSDQVATWEVPRDPAAVAPVRAACRRQLQEWGLDERSFTTELILSELVTNAVRYGSGPIRVRLVRDKSLICEVSDASSTSPHLRRAAATDEGGRGLFLVARYTERWGTRYTDRGKVIWAEQALHDSAADPDAEALLDRWEDF